MAVTETTAHVDSYREGHKLPSLSKDNIPESETGKVSVNGSDSDDAPDEAANSLKPGVRAKSEF